MSEFYQLVKQLKNNEIYMLIGNGSKNQFRYLSSLKQTLKKLLKQVLQTVVFILW